eukprot:gene14074-18884_t
MSSLFALIMVMGAVSSYGFNHLNSRIARSNAVMMKADTCNEGVLGSTQQKMKILTAALSILTAFSIDWAPANAANYGGFGSTYAEVVDPKTAVINEDAIKSEDVKSGYTGLIALKSTISAIKDDISKNPKLEVSQRLAKELEPGAVRLVLNKYNSAFSEDTQRGTDRLIRQFIQDLTELKRVVAVKPGNERSDGKAKLVIKRLTAAEAALDDLAAFYPK